jgi:hypothetical protein
LTVLSKLATAIGRRDDLPNQKLALELIASRDEKAIKELVNNLSNDDRNIQSDCIKVLYEIGERDPKLIAAHYEEFATLLASRNNRLVWGAMTALDSIALVKPKGVYGLLPKIVETANRGSVITRDHAVGILAKLTSVTEYSDTCFPLLLDQLRKCPNNQFPMYVEIAAPAVHQAHRADFVELVGERLTKLDRESQRRRVLKVLNRLTA